MNAAAGQTVAAWQRVDRRFLRFVARLEQGGHPWRAAAAVALLAEVTSFVVAASWFPDHAERFTKLAADPFGVGDIGLPWPEHRVRLLGPLLAWALGLQGLAGTLIPALANVPLLMITYRAISSRTTLVMGVLFTMLLATTHVTMTSRTILGYHDTLVFLCLIGAMLARSLPLACGLFFLALWGDARAALSIPLVLVWVLDQRPRGAPLRQFIGQALAFAATFAVWFGLAYAVTHAVDNQAATASRLSIYLSGQFVDLIKPGLIHLVAFMTFKAGWLLPVLLIWLWLGSRPWLVALIVASLLAIALPSLLIHDYSRALTFSFPLLFVSVCALHRANPQASPWIVGTCLLVNLITPFYQGMITGLWYDIYPLPVEILRRSIGS